MKTYKKWDTQEINKLKKLCKTKATRQEVAVAMNRTLKSVQRKAENEGILLPSKYKRKL